MRNQMIPPKSLGVIRALDAYARLIRNAWSEDQQNINTFAKLNSRKRDIEVKLARLKVAS
jgi:hypothetical protein